MRMLKKYFLGNEREDKEEQEYYFNRIKEELKEAFKEVDEKLEIELSLYKTKKVIFNISKSDLDKKDMEDSFKKITNIKLKKKELKYFQRKLEEFSKEDLFDARLTWSGIFAKII